MQTEQSIPHSAFRDKPGKTVDNVDPVCGSIRGMETKLHEFRHRRADWRRPPAQLEKADLLLRIFDDRIEGRETLSFAAREPLSEVALDAQDLDVGPVRLVAGPDAPDDAGDPCATMFDKKARKLTIALPRPIAAGDRFALRLDAVCRPTQNILDGAYFDVTPPGAPPQIISQCQQWGFQRILPIVDDCTAKCVWRTTLEGDARYTRLLSNGDVDRAANPDGRPVPVPDDSSRVRITYVNPIPMPPYLFLVAAGTWDELCDTVRTPAGRDVRLEYLVPPGPHDGARLPMEILKDAVLFQARHVGYDYRRECYRTICMEKSNFGGMENVGNTTIITEAALLDRWTTDRRLFYAFGVIVHEYEHNHCGSDVTMETPFDMWLNEAYTVTVEQAYLAARFGEAFARLDALDGLRDPLRGPLAQEDGGAAAFPIVRDGFDSPDDVVDGVTYDKAPEVLGMLREWLGHDAYKAATDAYFAKHAGGNANTDDLIGAFRPFAGGRDLDAFFHEWLFTVGYPSLTGSWTYDPAARRLLVTISQTRRDPAAAPFVVPFRVRGVDARGRAMSSVDRLLVLSSASETFVFEDVPEAPAFLDWNSGLPFYGTFRDDSATPESLTLAARLSPFPVGRVEAWRALVDSEMKRAIAAPDTAAPSVTFLSLLEASLADEALDPGLRARLLSIPEDMLDRDYVPRFAARAAAARALRRAAAAHLGADRLLAAYAAARTECKMRNAKCEARMDAFAAALPRRAVVRAIGALLALTGDSRAFAALRETIGGAAFVSEEIDAVAALQEAGAPGFRDDLRALGERCRPHVGAWAAWLSLVASDPNPDAVFNEVARVERGPGFRPEHPSHARYLYGALARNHAALWTPRGLAWLEETLLKTAKVNENVSILLLGALQLRRDFPAPLRDATGALLERVAAALPDAAPEAGALLARVRSLLG